ncbi:hypothetical protein B0H17DRAFT_1127326 [Mycena rosella]|uniref:Uncharacterized protein n=1 Tax=Mycena rosella TaxID=1033263 RepID=A0AAD7M6H9_MYCRO|nr:hypothetical protein B0H17DRAFT_1127326 [Mycena rosella]
MSSTKASCFIGIHKAPPNLTRAEFEAKMSQNTQMNQHISSVGLPVPAPTVVMSAEYEVRCLVFYNPLAEINYVIESGPSRRGAVVRLPTAQYFFSHFSQMLKDPALQKLLAEADNFGFRKGATAFAADIITKVETPGVTAGTNVVAVFHRPPHLSAERFAKQMEELMDKVIALPIRDRFSSYSLWLQNDAVDKQLQALGYPAPEPLVVVRVGSAIFEHSEVGRLGTEGMRDFGFHKDSADPATSCCFSADVSTKIDNRGSRAAVPKL